EEFACRQNSGLPWEDLIDEAGVYLGVQVAAAIFYHHQAVIGVGGVTDCRQDDPAGGDPKKDEGVDIIRPEDHVKVGAGERTYPVLGDRNIVPFRRNGGMNFARRTFKKLLVFYRGLDRAEQGVARVDLRKLGTEADPDVNNGHP